MKPYLLALLCSLSLTTSLSAYYEEAKSQIKDLRTDAQWRSVLIGYDAYYAVGLYDAYRYSLLVINMWERKYEPKKAPRFKIKDSLLTLMAISTEQADQGYFTVEESWSGQGFRQGLKKSISILEGKPFLDENIFH